MTFRLRRRPDDWTSVHERARTLAAVQVDEPLDGANQAWLDSHLSACPSCASIAASYVAQRAELQSLRREDPQPPRDLWARTAAAIEREAAVTGREPVGRRRQQSPLPLGVIAGVLVIAVVVGASLLSRPILPRTLPAGTPSASATSVVPTSPSTPALKPTPINVTADNVGWLTLGADGSVDVFDAPVDQVCATRDDADCPTIEQPAPKSIDLSQQPATVNRSPTDQGLVVVDSDTKRGGGEVYVLPAASSTPVATPSPVTSPTPVGTPVPSATPSAEPTAVVSASPTPALPTPEPTSPTPSASTEPTPSVAPTVPTPTPTASVRVNGTPGSGTIAIARDVIVVGESEAYSPDGTWFAFSARPASQMQGPDIYLWHRGDVEAHAITTDHRSVFGTWLDGQLLGSRIVAAAGQHDPTPTNFLIDPVTLRETPLNATGWRPSVDPRGRFAVYWEGSVALNEQGTELRPADGRLVLAPWRAATSAQPSTSPQTAEPAGGSASPSASPSSDPEASASPTPPPASATAPIAPEASPSATSSPAASDQAAASGSAGPSPLPSASPAVEAVALASGRLTDWDARWDETGTHLAVWIATDTASRIGDLTLYSVDAGTGRIKSLHRVAALAGFSIGKGRLAWATPRGQDGQGSRLQVVAWKNDAVGSIESRESSEVLVVIR
jgi:hypothetical protein